MLSIELSQMIEDPLRCLEAILQCYELLSPLIAHRIFNEITAFVSELLKCQLALLNFMIDNSSNVKDCLHFKK